MSNCDKLRSRWIAMVGIAVSAVGCAKKEHVDILGTESPQYSQGHEEVVVRDFFQDREGGFFLDVGCAHFKKHSTTYYLEKHLEWSGISIDALDGFREGFEKNRPRTKFFSYIVTDHSGTVESFYKLGQLSLMSTYDKEWADRFGKGDYEIIEIPTITLNELLEMNDVEKVDFLSMDIEGSEPGALAGFDIDRYKPELICIEAHPPVQKAILNYFKDHEYVLMVHYSRQDNGLNWYFRRSREDESPSARE